MTHSQSSRPEFLAGSANSLLWLHSGITQAAKAPSTQASPGLDPQHSGNCWGYKAWASSCCSYRLTVYSEGDWKHVKTVGYDRWCHKLWRNRQHKVERVDEQKSRVSKSWEIRHHWHSSHVNCWLRAHPFPPPTPLFFVWLSLSWAELSPPSPLCFCFYSQLLTSINAQNSMMKSEPAIRAGGHRAQCGGMSHRSCWTGKF